MKLLSTILLSTLLIGCQPKSNSESDIEISQFFEEEINQAIYEVKRTIFQIENNKQKTFTSEDLDTNPMIKNFDKIESLINHEQYDDAYRILNPNAPLESDGTLRFKLHKTIQHHYSDILLNPDVQNLNDWSITPLSLNVRDTIRLNTLNYGYLENNVGGNIDTTLTRELMLTVNNQHHEINFDELPFVSLPTDKLGINTTSLSYKFTNLVTDLEMRKTVTKTYFVK